ncbi:MAG: tyrosine-type recombinase/integrase [Janthinobacterium lividum]
MPEPKIRFFLHSVAATNGHRVIYLSVGVGEPRPVRQATSYAAHPAYFSSQAPHLLKGADGYRAINEKLDELRLAVAKACRRLEDEGQLSNAALAPLLKAAVVRLSGKPAKVVPAAPVVAPSALPLAAQPMRAVLASWKAENGAHLAKAYLDRSKQYVDWIEKFDPHATPAGVDEKWAKRYTSFLVRDTPLFNNTIHQHINMLRNLIAHAGLPTKFIKNGYAHEAKKCYLTWEELQQLHAWQPLAHKAALARQKDVFIARCLCGLRYSDAAALLRPHIKAGSQVNHIRLDQQKTRAAVQIPVVAMLQDILNKYQHLPGNQALPVISRQQTGTLIKEMLREAGIDAPYVQVRYKGIVKHETILPKWQAASTHTARHTYGALLAKMKVDPLTMRDLLGHGNLSSTMTYVHLEADETERTVLDGFQKLGGVGQ